MLYFQVGGTLDFKKFLFLKENWLFVMIGSPTAKILLKTDLNLETREWQVVFCFQEEAQPLVHEQIEDEEGMTVSRPNWQDVDIMKITDS